MSGRKYARNPGPIGRSRYDDIHNARLRRRNRKRALELILEILGVIAFFLVMMAVVGWAA